MSKRDMLNDRLFALKVEAIEKLVNAGKSVDEVAEELGRHKIWVYQILKKAGKKIVKHRALADKPLGQKKSLMDDIDELLRGGHEMGEIAKIVNVPLGGIYTTIAMAGKQVVVTGQRLEDVDG